LPIGAEARHQRLIVVAGRAVEFPERVFAIEDVFETGAAQPGKQSRRHADLCTPACVGILVHRLLDRFRPFTQCWLRRVAAADTKGMVGLIRIEAGDARGRADRRPGDRRGWTAQLIPADHLAVLDLHRCAHPASDPSTDVEADRDGGQQVVSAAGIQLCQCQG